MAAAQTAPFLVWFAPAGALVDRWPRKRIMLAADAGRAVALASVAMAVWLGWITVGYLIVVAFFEGTMYVFFLLGSAPCLARPRDMPGNRRGRINGEPAGQTASRPEHSQN